MSNTEQNTLGKKEELADIELKDLEVIDRFFSHFDLTTPDYLTKAITEYTAEQTLETEKNLKMNLLKSVIDNKDKVEGLDELFRPVINACGEMAYNLEFDKDLEEILTQDPTPEESSASPVSEGSETEDSPSTEA